MKEEIKLDLEIKYNNLIWTIFSVAVLSSFVILYIFWTNTPEKEVVRNVMMYLGFIVLVYSSLVIKQFGQKKKNLTGAEPNYIRSELIAELFLLMPLFFLYIMTAFYESQFILGGVMFLSFTIIFLNWFNVNVKKFNRNTQYWILIILLAILAALFFFSIGIMPLLQAFNSLI